MKKLTRKILVCWVLISLTCTSSKAQDYTLLVDSSHVVETNSTGTVTLFNVTYHTRIDTAGNWDRSFTYGDSNGEWTLLGRKIEHYHSGGRWRTYWDYRGMFGVAELAWNNSRHKIFHHDSWLGSEPGYETVGWSYNSAGYLDSAFTYFWDPDSETYEKNGSKPFPLPVTGIFETIYRKEENELDKLVYYTPLTQHVYTEGSSGVYETHLVSNYRGDTIWDVVYDYDTLGNGNLARYGYGEKDGLPKLKEELVVDVFDRVVKEAVYDTLIDAEVPDLWDRVRLFEYDASGRLIRMEEENISHYLSKSQRAVSLYDTLGRCIEKINYDRRTGEPTSKIMYEYSGDGGQTIRWQYSWDVGSGTWRGLLMNIYEYNELGAIILELRSKWNPEPSGEDWIWEYKYQYAYNDRGDRILSTISAWNPGSGEWVLKTRREYLYNAYGQRLEYTTNSYNETGESLATRSELFYPGSFYNIDNDSIYLGDSILFYGQWCKTEGRFEHVIAEYDEIADTVHVLDLSVVERPPYLDVSPSSESVNSESGSVSFIVSSNIDWTVSDDASWLTALKDGNTINVSYEDNTSINPRTASITASGGGLSETVSMIQAGVIPYLDVSANSESVSSESGSVSFIVSSNIDWTVSSSESWLAATKTDASTLTINYEENTSENERSATITLSGGGLSQDVTCVQEGASSTADDNYIKGQTITIYPNPMEDKLFIKAESAFGEDITIVLFDILGKQIHTQTIFQPNTGEIFSLDLSFFKSGTYFIRVNNSKTYKFQKL